MERRGAMLWLASFTLLTSMILILYFQVEGKFNSISFFIYQYFWLVLPHILSLIFIWFNKFKRPLERNYWCVAAMVMAIAGLICMADIIYWNPDTLGGIAVIMTPIIQIVILVFFALIM